MVWLPGRCAAVRLAQATQTALICAAYAGFRDSGEAAPNGGSVGAVHLYRHLAGRLQQIVSGVWEDHETSLCLRGLPRLCVTSADAGVR
jgi:hypothetical protein